MGKRLLTISGVKGILGMTGAFSMLEEAFAPSSFLALFVVVFWTTGSSAGRFRGNSCSLSLLSS
jgi:hypothetical protein